MISAENLTKSFLSGGDSITILKGLSFQVAPGSWTSVTGPSGSGKSTLLSLLAGLDVPTSGKITVAGIDLGAQGEEGRSDFRARKLGFVFQSFRLLPTLTALENVQLPLEILGTPDAEARARNMLARVGLEKRHDHLPSMLSGGEQQRVAIARAFVAHPPVVLADEPTGNLDSKNGERVLELMRELQRESGTTFIVVTHDPGVAARGDAELKLRDGLLV
jgi:putative ABC transport system ATP-binding protein